MKVKLGNLELQQVQEVTVCQRRSLVEQKPPGMAGSFLQNLGRHPAAIFVWGVAAGPSASAFIEKLEAKFRAGTPSTFTAESITGAAVKQVFVADLRFEDVAGKPFRFVYALSLREFVTAAKPPGAQALNSGIRAEARKLVRNQTARLTRKK